MMVFLFLNYASSVWEIRKMKPSRIMLNDFVLAVPSVMFQYTSSSSCSNIQFYSLFAYFSDLLLLLKYSIFIVSFLG